MWNSSVRAEQAPRAIRQSGLGVKSGRLWSTTLEVFSQPTSALGVVIIVLLVAMALAAPLIVPENPRGTYQMPRDFLDGNLPPGSPGYLLGTTRYGGDLLYGIVWGARLSLILSVVVVGGAVLIGLIVGGAAGFFGGKVDALMMRVVDVFLSVPELIFPLAIAAILGPSFINIMVALTVIIWARYARIIRGQILLVREEDYVAAARSIGASGWGIVRKDILPNSITPVAVQATLDMGHVVLLGATLSFIGLSQAGLAEWGRLVSEGQQLILAGRWWMSTFAGLMIFLWALSFNLVGDGIRDVLDPRTEDR